MSYRAVPRDVSARSPGAENLRRIRDGIRVRLLDPCPSGRDAGPRPPARRLSTSSRLVRRKKGSGRDSRSATKQKKKKVEGQRSRTPIGLQSETPEV